MENKEIEQEKEYKGETRLEKEKKRRKIITIVVIASLIVDIILLIILLLVRINKNKGQSSSNNDDSSSVYQYEEEVNTFKQSLLTIMNNYVDDDMSKSDTQYDLTNIISISTDTSNHVIYTGYNDNYIATMSLELNNLNDFINDINNQTHIVNKSCIYLDIDNVSSNPLLEDTDFTKDNKSQIKYKLASNGATHKALSASYFDTTDNSYYSITNYQYEIGEFHFSNITADNITQYTLEQTPIMYYLIQGL